MSNFRPIERATPFLLPPSVDDWLPKDHLARFVVDIVDQLDLSPLTKQYRGAGSAAYHPAVMLSLLVYGYATGVFSSRRIEAATHDSIAFRYIAANEQPDHDSLCAFRKRFLPELTALFTEVLCIARQLKLLKLQARAEKEARTGKKPGGKPPAPPSTGVRPTDQINLTDPDSRMMPVTGKGFAQSYNAQAAVDTDSMLVVATTLTQASTDKQQLEPMLAVLTSLPEALGSVERLLADNGYFSAANVEHCVTAKSEPLLAAGRDSHHPHWADRCTEPPASREWRCWPDKRAGAVADATKFDRIAQFPPPFPSTLFSMVTFARKFSLSPTGC